MAELMPFLSKVSNLVTRSDYLSKLASLLGSDPSAVIEESKKYLSTKTAPSIGESSTTPVIQIPKIDILEAHLLSLIFSAKKPYTLAAKIAEKLTFSTPRFQKMFVQLLKPRKIFKPSRFSSHLPAELLPTFQDIFLHSTQFSFDPHGRLLEINKTINQILTITLRDQLSAMSAKIAQAENQGSEDIVKKLEIDYNHLLQQLSAIQSIKR